MDNNIELPQLKCLRCGHTWIPRNTKIPKVCPNPKCKSPYWNKSRNNERRKTIPINSLPVLKNITAYSLKKIPILPEELKGVDTVIIDAEKQPKPDSFVLGTTSTKEIFIKRFKDVLPDDYVTPGRVIQHSYFVEH
jgi:hypothetical protein